MTEPLEIVAGLLLVFFLPGFAITRALFPERRVFRPLSWKNLLEQLTSSVVLSVALTILVGFVWLGTSTGVQANWSDPLEEATLGAVAAVALGIAVARGGFSVLPPKSAPLEPQGGHSDPVEVVHRLDLLAREERTLTHRIRVVGSRSDAAQPLVQELERVQGEAARLRAEREEEYARP
ncbi:MAG TPA: DUF1616 domain-containing protein [Thermoplasmata archaeon]|nr:DUF1616 domain-containing protein [Thermoplasmata archaeon]